MGKSIFIFSGLGADERVFQRLDLSGHDVTFVQWINPVAAETIKDYAGRISKQITAKDPVLIGLSFGGMIAVEVANLMPVNRVILLSSAKSKKEIPFYFRLAGALQVHKLVPVSFMKKASALSYWLFGASSRFDRHLLKKILQETDEIFLKWAIDKIVRWSNEIIPKNMKHIHGTKDRVLPIRFVQCDIKVTGGGHFMVLDKANEITEILKCQLK